MIAAERNARALRGFLTGRASTPPFHDKNGADHAADADSLHERHSFAQGNNGEQHAKDGFKVADHRSARRADGRHAAKKGESPDGRGARDADEPGPSERRGREGKRSNEREEHPSVVAAESIM